MPDVLITAPTTEPVSAAEAQAHLRLEGDATDTYVESLIVVARSYVEQYLDRALITQTWETVLDEFPDDEEIVLAKGHLQSVTSVKYFDISGVEQTLSSSAYQVDSVSEPGRVVLASGYSWPDTQDEKVNALRVRYVAGYGSAGTVPQPIKHAILLLIGQLYEHREPEITGTIVSRFEFAVDSLLAPYRLHWIG